jgi:anti-sigma-K factor RskA
MNIAEYINSGVIEDYCLGVLNPEEQQCVAQNAARYAEIQRAIEENEDALKRFVEDSSVTKKANPMEKEWQLRLLKNREK